MSIPIIFTHYGVSDYLWRTLKCAKITNPGSELIFIGDPTNEHVARECGWTFVNGDEVSSVLRTEFLHNFRPISGPLHTDFKNGRSWLRYVTERWFIVEAVCQSQEIREFWHFDSDTMIVEDLSWFAKELSSRRITHTRQANDCGMNGFVTSRAATDFCQFLISIYRDDDKKEELEGWQERLNTIEPTGGFTEMVSFLWFARDMKYDGPHLEGAFDGWWFDDCLCQDDGFEVTRLNFVGRFIKRVDFDGHMFSGTRGSETRRFATINCSWVNIALFDFLLKCVERRSKGIHNKRSLATEWLGISHFVKAAGYRTLKASGLIKA